MSTFTKRPPAILICAAAVALVALSGCAQFPRAMTEPSIATSTAGSIDAAMAEKSNDTFDVDAGYVSDAVFMLRQSTDVGIIPDRQVKSITITESGVFDALRLIGKDAGLSLNVEGGINGSERYGSNSAFNIHGSLKNVLEELSETMGFFYSVRRNTLFIEQEQQFVIELPPALNEDNTADLTNTLQFLGAKDAYVDRISRSLVFKTNRKALPKIEAYMQKIRDTRSLIVYDVNIFQVDLKDNLDTGIQWNKLGWNGTPISSQANTIGVGSSAGGVGAEGAAAVVGKALTATKSLVGMGLVLSGTHFSIDSLISFLQTQGSVKAVSRPRLAIISGTKGMLRVGQVTTFVSKVGTNFSTSVNQVTTETRDLKTGMELGLFGDYSDNTVYTRVGLVISEITRLDRVEALGTSFTLPQIADRELNTIVRARPGDMILLGGITMERDSSSANGGIGGFGKSKEITRSELVLTLKARIVNFRGKERTLSDSGDIARPKSGPLLVGVDSRITVPVTTHPQTVLPLQVAHNTSVAAKSAEKTRPMVAVVAPAPSDANAGGPQ